LPDLDDKPEIDGMRVSEISPDALRIVNESIHQAKRQLQQEQRVPNYLTE
jgi:hypothetical protein